MALSFSSTKPNAFDTKQIAAAKLLQVASGDEQSINEGSTVEYSETRPEAFDTAAISLEKLLQSGGFPAPGVPTDFVFNEVSGSGIELGWTNVSPDTWVEIQYSYNHLGWTNCVEGEFFAAANPTALNATSYFAGLTGTPGGLEVQETFVRYRIRAGFEHGHSYWSAPIQVPPFNAISDLAVEIGDPLSAVLTWTLIGENVDYIVLSRRINAGSWVRLADEFATTGDATTITDDSSEFTAARGSGYAVEYRIDCTNAGGTGPFSNVATLEADMASHLLDGLDAHWYLDVNGGNLLVDGVGSRDLTNHNGASSTTGGPANLDNVATLDGVSQAFSAPFDAVCALGGGGSGTFGLWFKQESAGAFGIVVGQDDSILRNFYVLIDSGVIYFDSFDSDGTFTRVTGPSISLFTWYYITFGFDESTGKVFLRINDGTLYETVVATGELANENTPLYIGERQTGGSEGFFEGFVVSMDKWNRILNTQEINDLYNSGDGLDFGDYTA